MSDLKKMLSAKTGIVDFIFYLLGATVYALAVNVFILPHQIAPGGVTGIASILHNTLGLDAGIMYFVLNLPLFAIAFKVFGFKFLYKTFIAMTLVSVMTEVTARLFPNLQYSPSGDTAEGLIAALIGGVLSGLGLALIFLRGATTGGSEIGARLLRKLFPGLSFGRTILVIDLVVVLAGYIVLRDINSAFFSVIVVYITSVVIDTVLDGNSVARVAFILSERTDDIKEVLLTKLDRGVTVFEGHGGYTNKEVKMIMCAIRRHQVQDCRRAVKEFDPKAFVMILHATEVLGEGFTAVTDEPL